MPSFFLQEEPAAPRELGLGLGLGLKEKEEVVVAAAAGLEEAGAAVAVGAGGTPAGPAVIGPSLPLALVGACAGRGRRERKSQDPPLLATPSPMRPWKPKSRVGEVGATGVEVGEGH